MLNDGAGRTHTSRQAQGEAGAAATERRSQRAAVEAVRAALEAGDVREATDLAVALVPDVLEARECVFARVFTVEWWSF